MIVRIILIATLAFALALGRPQNSYAGGSPGSGNNPSQSQLSNSQQASFTSSSAGGQAPNGRSGIAAGSSSSSSISRNNTATIVKKEFQDDGAGNFRWDFEDSDGTKVEQSGRPSANGSLARSGPVNASDDGADESGPGEAIQGSYSYKAPDGKVISLSYVADENGFQPRGDHLPTSPPDPNAAAQAQAHASSGGGSQSSSSQSQGSNSVSNAGASNSNGGRSDLSGSVTFQSQQSASGGQNGQTSSSSSSSQQYANAG